MAIGFGDSVPRRVFRETKTRPCSAHKGKITHRVESAAAFPSQPRTARSICAARAVKDRVYNRIVKNALLDYACGGIWNRKEWALSCGGHEVRFLLPPTPSVR
jgi:hypothetical protein